MTTPLEAVARAFPGLAASDDPADRVAYGRDLWPRHHLDVRRGLPAEHRPSGIVWPTTAEEVARLVQWARGAGVALVPFGAGSGVCGGVLPGADALVVDLKRMARLHAIVAAAPLVDVEAGHMGVPLEEALGRAGFTLGHFPSSILCSTVGGWIATRSAGQCSGAYGKIEDMVLSLTCVTGRGEIVELARRSSGPDLVPLVVGSEGTLAFITRAKLRIHPAPAARAFGAWSFPSTEAGWEAMRAIFQSGLRPAVARLYDPFDAMLAKRGAVKAAREATHAARDALGATRPGGANGARTQGGRASAGDPRTGRAGDATAKAPGYGGTALRALLRRPALLNEVLSTRIAARALGGAMLVLVFEGVDAASVGAARPGGASIAAADGMAAARAIIERVRGTRCEGEAPARRWFNHRYAVSYRQAPVFANGAFVDTMEVATTWSNLGRLYDSVRSALGEDAFVMAHFSHAYPDGCCIYFSFAGRPSPADARGASWDEASAVTYDRIWRRALQAAVAAGGTLAHHHGVGRSKAPRLGAELGAGVRVVRSVMKAFDPDGILNPGNLVPRERADDAKSAGDGVLPRAPASHAERAPGVGTEGGPMADVPAIELDAVSGLASVEGGVTLETLEEHLNSAGLTLDVRFDAPGPTVAAWLAQGAPGARDRWLDPVDQLLAGLEATLTDGRSLRVHPAPRRAVGPDLTTLFVGAHGRFGRIDRAWLRVHARGVARPSAPSFVFEREPEVSVAERDLLDAVARALSTRS